MSSGPRAPLPIVTGSRSAITDNPGSASIATRSGLSAVSPARPDNASIEKSTRRQPRAPASHRQRAVSVARCAVRSEGVQRGEPSGQPSPDRRCGQDQTRSSDR